MIEMEKVQGYLSNRQTLLRGVLWRRRDISEWFGPDGVFGDECVKGINKIVFSLLIDLREIGRGGEASDIIREHRLAACEPTYE